MRKTIFINTDHGKATVTHRPLWSAIVISMYCNAVLCYFRNLLLVTIMFTSVIIYFCSCLQQSVPIHLLLLTLGCSVSFSNLLFGLQCKA